MVTDSSSNVEGGGADSSRPPLFRYTDKFVELCPYYMALGMSYDEYWNGDNELPKFYREKFKIEVELQAQNMWVQGAYFYDSMCRTAPLYDFMNKKRKPIPYPEHPYPATAEQQARYAKEEARKQYEANLAWMQARRQEINEQFKESE